MSYTLAIIGGSQAYTLLETGKFAGEELGPIATPFGDSQPIFRVEHITHHPSRVTDHESRITHHSSLIMYFLSRHGMRSYSVAAPWVNYRANIWALKELGVTSIVSWSGPGAIDESLEIGQFVLPDDLIDETKARRSSFFEGTGWGFVRQNPVFCPTLRSAIAGVMEELGLIHRTEGVYVCTEGPRLETPAEIRKYRMFGGHLVGMTLVPEAFLAKELEMCYAPICYITNYAEGIREREFSPGVLFEGLLDDDEQKAMQDSVERFPGIIALLAERLPQTERSCHCDKLMERYRRRGDIGPDWHTWIRE